MIPIHISHDERIPIYVQIADQIKDMIGSGVFANGDALPSRQSIARQTGVNINTINHAYRILENEGYVTTRRGIGSFVHVRGDFRSRAESVEKIRSQLRELRRRALTFGLSAGDFKAIVQEITEIGPSSRRPRSAFIECHRAWTDDPAARLQAELGLDVLPVVMPDRKTNLKGVIDAIGDADFVITTHAHYIEVREITDEEKKVFPLDLHLSYEVMTALSKIREGRIAVPFLKSVTTKRLGHWIKAMGFPIDLVPIRHKDAADLQRKVKGYKVLMVPPSHLEEVKASVPGSIELISIRSVLGEDSLRHLKEAISGLYPDTL